MVREYVVPPVSGDKKREPYRLRIFDDISRPPFELGDLSRKSFDYVGEWMTVGLKSGYGFYYRLAYKEGIIDDEGDDVAAVFHILIPFVPKGEKMPKEVMEKINISVKDVTRKFTVAASQMYGMDVTSIVMEPNEWMRKDLERFLE